MKRAPSRNLLLSVPAPRGGWAALAVCVALCCTVLGAQQTWAPQPHLTRAQLDPGPGEITVDKAVEACLAFFRRMGVDAPSRVPFAERTGPTRRARGTIFLEYPAEALITVDVRTGAVDSYENERRESDRMGGKLPPGTLLLGDALTAHNYVWSVIKKIGVAKDCKLIEFRFRPPDTNGAASSDKYVSIRATFQPMPFGYQFRDEFGRSTIELDPLDGAVIFYANAGAVSPPFKIESRSPVLKVSDATAKAEPLVKKYAVGAGSNPGSEPKPASKTRRLMFVHPNGEMGGVEYPDDENPARLRLAWVLYYAWDDEIWIDAADGKVLGGSSYRENTLRSLRHR